MPFSLEPKEASKADALDPDINRGEGAMTVERSSTDESRSIDERAEFTALDDLRRSSIALLILTGVQSPSGVRVPRVTGRSLAARRGAGISSPSCRTVMISTADSLIRLSALLL